MFRCQLVLLCSLFLFGCASIYHPQEGDIPEGYSSEKVSENEYEVSFQSYKGEDWQTLEEFVQQRVREIQVANYYESFEITKLERSQRHEVLHVPGVTAPQVLGNCGYSCTSQGAGYVQPEYDIAFEIKRIVAHVKYK